MPSAFLALPTVAATIFAVVNPVLLVLPTVNVGARTDATATAALDSTTSFPIVFGVLEYQFASSLYPHSSAVYVPPARGAISTSSLYSFLSYSSITLASSLSVNATTSVLSSPRVAVPIVNLSVPFCHLELIYLHIECYHPLYFRDI